jgi:DNA polymerase (family 10)
MAEAALACGFDYIAITDHSKNLAMTNGLDDQRALEHVRRIREVDDQMAGRIRVFTGIEVDILADGALDLDDEVLAQMDIVIASVHTRFDQSREETTARVLRAIENPYVGVLGHPTGRLLLRREPFALDLGAVLRRAAELGVGVEHNAAPERLDLSDRDLRLAKGLGCKIVINSDSHDARNLGFASCAAPGWARTMCSIPSGRRIFWPVFDPAPDPDKGTTFGAFPCTFPHCAPRIPAETSSVRDKIRAP